MKANIQEQYQLWLNETDLTAELKALGPAEIEDRFYQSIEFGTGGMRGLMGAGTNRINKYTIMQACLALAKLIQQDGFKTGKVVIAHDTRNQSDYLARCAAEALASQGVKVLMFDQPTPTPVLSFAVRDLACQYGIVITASHNPKEYNGFKVYNAQGGQLLPNQAIQLTKLIDPAYPLNKLNYLTYLPDDIQSIDLSYRQRYMAAIQGISADLAGLDIVYSPLHGSGYKYVSHILQTANLQLVDQQITFDGDFPTVKVPNPEEREAMEVAVAQAQKTQADLVLATDPDCDRLGAVVNHQGEFIPLTGNQIGALMIDFLTKHDSAQNKYVVKTVVTSELGARIAESRGAKVLNTLTGFKYIGEIINQLENKDQADQFLFGYEESYGYLWGSHCRDKDAIISAYLLALMAKEYKQQGLTLIDQLEEIYREYGYYLDHLASFTFTGSAGQERMVALMADFRNLNRQKLGHDYQLLDYQAGLDQLPPANLLKFVLDDGSWVAIRPSGTEPKLKIYFSIRATDKETAQDKLNRLKTKLSEIIDAS